MSVGFRHCHFADGREKTAYPSLEFAQKLAEAKSRELGRKINAYGCEVHGFHIGGMRPICSHRKNGGKPCENPETCTNTYVRGTQ